MSRFRGSEPGNIMESNNRQQHVIVSRFSVPRLDPRTADRHLDPDWLDERLKLFRRFFVPSVQGLGVPVVLLCSSPSAERISGAVADLPWATVEVQDDWYAGWTGSERQVVTRLDSDDAVHRGWFEAVERALPQAEVVCSRHFLRLDLDRRRLFRYRRREPSPLVAFGGGRNPYAHDHAELTRHEPVHLLDRPYLLQVVHGGNLSNRRPTWRRVFSRLSLDQLEPYGIELPD